MARTRLLLSQKLMMCIVLTVWGASVVAHAQAQAAAVAPVKKSCTVNTSPPNPAETALNKGDFSSAETLFRALLANSADNESAHEALIRTILAQDMVADAAKDAESWAASAPSSSMALTALGDVRLRQGEPRLAFTQFQKAAQADLCNARAYYGLAQVDGLAGMYASGKRLIEQAYKLHPSDDDINTAWIATLPRAERLAKWADYAEHSDQISEQNRAKLKTRLQKESLSHASDCRMAPTSPREATIPMATIMDGPNRMAGYALDVKFNGKGRRLQIDTGSGGIMISRAAALFLGIQREDASKSWGVGDEGDVKTSVTHVASIKIGGVEFTNCRVEILEKWSVLDTDGLIGGDVFADSLLTLDFPKRQLRLAPLPERPGDKKSDPASSGAAGDDEDVEPHDQYIAPGMEKWQWIYRSGHDLLMPTGIVETNSMKEESAWKEKLFLLDTGAESNLISPAAAKEVTKVFRDESMEISGISGKVDKVYQTDKFTLAFAGLRLDSPPMTAIDTTKLSHDDGVEISGLIGQPALFQVVMHIDYRDNLVWCEYTAKK